MGAVRRHPSPEISMTTMLLVSEVYSSKLSVSEVYSSKPAYNALLGPLGLHLGKVFLKSWA